MPGERPRRVEICRCGHDDAEHKSGGFLHRGCEVDRCTCINFTFSRSERRKA